MNAKVSEIFQSIQGEGKYAGVRQAFIRFFGCNIHCVWCDTPLAIGDSGGAYTEYTVDGLWTAVRGLCDGIHSLSLTGGEPLTQAEFLQRFLPRARAAGVRVYLETNGILPDQLAAVIEDVDIVSMDVKLPSSAKCPPFWKEHEAFLRIARRKEVFVKAVISSDTLREDAARCADLISSVDRNIVCVLQPNYFERNTGALDKCLEFAQYCSRQLNDVRVLPQMHKILKLR